MGDVAFAINSSTELYRGEVKVATKRAEKFSAGKDQKENLGKPPNILSLELTAHTKVQEQPKGHTRLDKTGEK